MVIKVPEPGSVNAAECLHTADALTAEALVAARSRLNPAAGTMLSALWVTSTGQLALIIHHLAIDAVSWRILLEDLNIAWAQHHSGQPIALPAGGTSFTRWAGLLAEHAHTPAVVEQADAWKQVTADPGRAAGGATRRWTPMPAPGTCRQHWTPKPPACCSVRSPQRFTRECKTSC